VTIALLCFDFTPFNPRAYLKQNQAETGWIIFWGGFDYLEFQRFAIVASSTPERLEISVQEKCSEPEFPDLFKI
jgi:hypothetical protein